MLRNNNDNRNMFKSGNNIDNTQSRFQFDSNLVNTSSSLSKNALWQCGMCTYRNLHNESMCTVCGRPKSFSDEMIDERNRVIDRIGDQIQSLQFNTMAMQIELDKAQKERIEQKDKIQKKTQIADRRDSDESAYYPWDEFYIEHKPSSYSTSSDQSQMPINHSAWPCNTCTLENQAHESQCVACETPRFSDAKIDQDGYQLEDVPAPNFNQYPNATRKRSSHTRNESLISLYEAFNPNSQEVRVPSQHMTNHNMVAQFGATHSNSGTKVAFERAAVDIQIYNTNPKAIFDTLHTVASKLLKDDDKYCTLDTTNPKVEQKLLGYEGVIDFLKLLGFESDSRGEHLICKKKDMKVIFTALEVLDVYKERLEMELNVSKHHNAKIAKGGNETPNGIDIDAHQNQYDDDMMLEQILLLCTNEQRRDFATMETLIMCYKEFSTSEKLIQGLRHRFFTNISNSMMPNDENEKTRKSIQLAILKILQGWMKSYWQEDFANDNKLQNILQSWIQQMSEEAEQNREYNKWAESIRNVYQRCIKKWDELPKNKQDYSLVSIPDKFTFQTLTPEELSSQITLMDFRIFSGIRSREYLGQAWKKKDKEINSPNLLAMIQQFNNVSRFIQMQILFETSPKRRGRAIKRAIEMGECFRKNRNYSSLCAVFTALSGPSIHRLQSAWEKVPEKQKQQITQFRNIFERDFNHRNLRQLFRSAEFPSIPHIGLFLQDLVFIDEGNENKKEIENLRQEMINFSKLQKMADRIKTIQLYQQHPYNYLQENNVAQKMLIQEFSKCQQMTEDQIWEKSTQVKEADKNYKSKKFKFFSK